MSWHVNSVSQLLLGLVHGQVKAMFPNKMRSALFSSLFGSKQSWCGTAWQRLLKRNAVLSKCHWHDTGSVSREQEHFDSSPHNHHSPGMLLSSILYSGTHCVCSDCTQSLKGILPLIQECSRYTAHWVDEWPLELCCKLVSVWPAPQTGGE